MNTDKTNRRAKALIKSALEFSANKDSYWRRRTSNPLLSELGKLPDEIDEIICDQKPNFCHSLALRMATYSDNSDNLFKRWNTLLENAKKADGWENEYENWSNENNHWAIEWDRFNQFLWFLQCFEYFSENSQSVSFPTSKEKAPDLCVQKANGKKVFVECYYYTKWWGREHFLEDLLNAIDTKLKIKRKYNFSYKESGNPMADKNFVETLAILKDNFTEAKLLEHRTNAGIVSPQLVCDIGDFSILLEGNGEYQPDDNNAQGDPSNSRDVFLQEIINHKKDKNDLGCHHPNLLMVNSLGLDFQLIFDEKIQNVDFSKVDWPESLDKVRIYKCGINDRVSNCDRMSLQLQSGPA